MLGLTVKSAWFIAHRIRYAMEQNADNVVVNHWKKEYRRGIIHTNTIEGYFSLLKLGVNGTFHHLSKKYLLFI